MSILDKDSAMEDHWSDNSRFNIFIKERYMTEEDEEFIRIEREAAMRNTHPPLSKEIATMKTPWDSDKILMVDIGCVERGCMGVASDYAAGIPPECRAMQEYRDWVDLTDGELSDAYALGGLRLVQSKIKEKNT